MKRNLMHLLFFTIIFCAAFFVKSEKAMAKTLISGKTYKIDLNGDGVKERIKCKSSGDHPCKASIYINGAKIASFKDSGSISCWFSVVDINSKDKYKEIYAQFTSESDCFEKGYGYRYNGKKLVKKFTFTNPASWRISILDNQPGDGNVYFSSEYYTENLMQGAVVQGYSIKSGKLRVLHSTVLDTTDSWRTMLYRSTEELRLYTNINDEEPADTLDAYEVFNIYKVKLSSYKSLSDTITYVYIKTEDGTEGWLQVPSSAIIEGKYGYESSEWSTWAYTWG